MKKIDWVRKLTSRKLWVSIASFVSLLAVAFGVTESEATQITAIIMAGATALGYIIGEGLVDASSSPQQTLESTDIADSFTEAKSIDYE